MAVLQIKNLHKSYGPRVIFESVNISFTTDQRIGMIGRNGAGKSTLCRIVLGQEEADAGTIIKSVDLRLSYLEQHDPYSLEETVAGFLARYTNREEWECAEVAHKFQIDHEKFYAPIKNLSGGYQTRVKLSAMLLRDPNFLILDEPSNYLDLNTLILLENFLHSFNGGYIIISHDREFLKRTCDQTMEAELGELVFYPGPIEDYLEFKEGKREQAASVNKNIEGKQKQLQRFIDRFGTHAAKAQMAKSKQKQIERLDKDKIEVKHIPSSVHITTPQINERSGTALDLDDLAIGYPEKLVAEKINATVDRGSHVAVLGENGQGKTTFLKTIVGELAAKTGGFRWGSSIKIGYYAQHVFQTLHPEYTVLNYLQAEAASDVDRQKILDLAGCFLFGGDDVGKKVKVLSGGERARLVLAGLLLSKCNVLLLDEPTNHLDFETVEALGEALSGFNGTIFFICHDRTFVQMLANYILDVKDGKIEKYPGTYDDYVDFLERKAREEMGEPEPEETKPEKPKKSKEEKRAEREIKAQIEGLEAEMKDCETKLENYRKERDEIQAELMSSPDAYSAEKHIRLDRLAKMITSEEARWISLGEKLNNLK